MSEVGYMAHRQKMLHTPDLDQLVEVTLKLLKKTILDPSINTKNLHKKSQYIRKTLQVFESKLT